MSLAIDAIILLSAVIIIWRGAGRGLVKSMMGLVTSVVSFIVAYAYTPVLADIVRDKYLSEPITNGIFETLKSLAFDTNTDLYNLDRLAVDMPEPFTSILERYNVNITTFTEKIKGITGCGENTVRAFAEEIAKPTSQIIANCASFIVIFLAAFIVLSLLTAVLNLIFKLPVLSQANSVLGMAFGAVEAVLFAFVLATVLASLVSSLGSIDPSLFGKDVVEDTRICRYLIAHNPIKEISSIINW